MSEDDLTTWLRARFDEDEQVARDAAESVGDGHWQQRNVRVVTASDRDRGVADYAVLECIDHVVRHDPTRVLAEVEAKQRIMDEIFAYEAKIDSEWGCCHSADDIAAGKCPDTELHGIPALLMLALPYADRPGYREEWRS